jgi:sugar lactone lactonase YvrE
VDSGQRLGTNSSHADVALGDLDGDGDLDAIIARTGTNSQVWINRGGAQGGTAGQFVAGQNLANGQTAAVALADLDGDGDLDVFFADRTGPNQIWINQGGLQGGTNGVFLQSVQITPINEPASGIALGPLDGNPGLDAFVTRAGGFAVWTNNGSGQFTLKGQILSNEQWQNAALGDFDGDGDQDAFILAGPLFPNSIWRNQGGIFLNNQNLDNTTGYGESVALGDLDGDQDLDAFVAGIAGNRVWVNQGNGTFATAGVLFGNGAYDVALGDLDRDGDLDAFVARYSSQDGVFENDGTGQFTDTGLRLGTQQSFAVALGDLDGDGDLDAFIAKYQKPCEVWFNATPPIVPVPTFPEYIITTIAGNGTFGSTGDGGPATNAALAAPTHVAVDAQGNVFIAAGGDPLFRDHRVRKVGTNGILVTFAGTGVPGFSGNDGPATNAQLSSPRGVAVDGTGNVYIADSGNHRVRRVDTNGIITTFAGSGSPGSGGDEGPATSAQLHGLNDVAVDAIGNVYIVTLDRIRKVDTDGIIRTAEGVSGSILESLAVNDAGNLYFADLDHRHVSLVGTNGGTTVFAGQPNTYGYRGNGGQATDALLSSPEGVAVDAAGSVFIADAGNHRIRRVDTNGIISTVAGSGAVDFSGDGGPARAANLRSLRGLTVDAARNVFVIDGNRVRRLTPTGRNLRLAPAVVTHFVAYELSTKTELSDGILEAFIAGLSLPDAGPAVPASARQLSRQAAGKEFNLPQTAILDFNPAAPHSLTSEVPAFLGGGSVQLSNFTGSVTVSLLPFPNDPDHAFLRIDSGSFMAPSVQLPSGLRTGPNTLTFGPASQSEGLLNLTNGAYTVTATATIVNDLVPEGFPVRGSYSGTFDQATGQASVQSESRDFFRRSERLQFSRVPGGFWLTWIGGDVLEEAPNVLGPWRAVPNCASPHPVFHALQQQFFRLRRPAP